MKITVIGSGCPTCEALYNRVKRLVQEGKIDAQVEYIRDFNELVKRGIMGSPALLIDDKPVFVGAPGSDEDLLEIIKRHEE